MRVVKSGRTSGINYGTITDVNATVKVEGWGDCIFKNQIIIEPAIIFPGDSGSWVGEVDSWRTVGVAHASSEVVSVANRAKVVERLLDIEIIPPTRPIPIWMVAGMVGSMFYTGLSLSKHEEVAGVAD